MPYTLPAQERGEKRGPEDYNYCRLCTDGTVKIAKVVNGTINKSGDSPVMTAFACIDEGPLAGMYVIFSRTLTPKSIWSLKNAVRATGTDEGIPLNTEYTFKDDADVLDRVHRMSGIATMKQSEMKNGDLLSAINYFIAPDDETELAKHEPAQPIADRVDESDDLDL